MTPTVELGLLALVHPLHQHARPLHVVPGGCQSPALLQPAVQRRMRSRGPLLLVHALVLPALLCPAQWHLQRSQNLSCIVDNSSKELLSSCATALLCSIQSRLLKTLQEKLALREHSDCHLVWLQRACNQARHHEVAEISKRLAALQGWLCRGLQGSTSSSCKRAAVSDSNKLGCTNCCA